MISYNRLLPERILRAFDSGAPFHELVRRSREVPLLDLQFRGVKNDRRATLYFGLTSLMSLRLKVVRDEVHYSFVPHAGKNAPESPLTGERFPADSFPRQWPDINDYLERLMGTTISKQWTDVEGSVQSSLEATRLVAVLDREVVLAFSSKDERTETKARVTKRFMDVINRIDQNEQWLKKSIALGNELDVLAVDGKGRVLLIELKPASSTAGIAWSAAQVGVYRDLFAEWVRQEGEAATDTLDKMLTQRQRVGLVEPHWRIRRPVDFVPVVGIGGDIRSKKSLSRLRFVQDALVKANVGDPKLEVWQFGIVKRNTWQKLPQT